MLVGLRKKEKVLKLECSLRGWHQSSRNPMTNLEPKL